MYAQGKSRTRERDFVRQLRPVEIRSAMHCHWTQPCTDINLLTWAAAVRQMTKRTLKLRSIRPKYVLLCILCRIWSITDGWWCWWCCHNRRESEKMCQRTMQINEHASMCVRPLTRARVVVCCVLRLVCVCVESMGCSHKCRGMISTKVHSNIWICVRSHLNICVPHRTNIDNELDRPTDRPILMQLSSC